MKDVKVFLSPEAKKVLAYLNQESEHSKIERSILKAIKYKIDLVKMNPNIEIP